MVYNDYRSLLNLITKFLFRYNLTGVVNAPILTASQNTDNIPWIELAKGLGKYAVKIAQTEDLSNVNVVVTSHGMINKFTTL